MARWLWECSLLSPLAARLQADFLYSPAGVTVPTLRLPQVVLAPNPWGLVDSVERGPIDRLKAVLQRRAYKAAMKRAVLMIFISRFMHQAYLKNAGFASRVAQVIYIGIADEIHEMAAKLRGQVKRNPKQIISVSAMAPHKGVETTIEALGLLRSRFNIAAQLFLIGSWPDRSYEKKMRRLTTELRLKEAVHFTGRVPTRDLHRLFLESQVFCLMSRCESFGLPAVEAQAFGTPVVSSNCCAIPEICGRGGFYPEPGDAAGTAQALARLLSEPATWAELSAEAVKNAAKYQWDLCARPLLEMFDVVKKHSSSANRTSLERPS